MGQPTDGPSRNVHEANFNRFAKNGQIVASSNLVNPLSQESFY